MPSDDTGTIRKFDINDIENIHNQFNDVENNYPKNKYSEKIKKFLQKHDKL